MPTHIERIEHIENAHFYGGHNQALHKVNTNTPIHRFLSSLKERYQNRYIQKLDDFFEITLVVKKDWNSIDSQIEKVNYKSGVNTGKGILIVSETFSEKGRLLIVGNPGAGKTVLLLKLALNLLEKCDLQKKDYSIPVIFNLASWSDKYKDFEDWLINVLITKNGLSKAFAKDLLDKRKIVFLLDGLDELAQNEREIVANNQRANCLKSIHSYLKRNHEAVICCRRVEFEQIFKQTKQDAPVSAKIEVLDLTEDDVLSALEQAKKDKNSRTAANNLLRLKDHNENVLKVLSTPFYFTTALEVFDQQNIDAKFVEDALKSELNFKHFLVSEFCNKRFVQKEGFDTSKGYWLRSLADLMKQRQLVTLELGDLQPEDLYTLWWFDYKLIFCLIGSIIGGLWSVFFSYLFEVTLGVYDPVITYFFRIFASGFIVRIFAFGFIAGLVVSFFTVLSNNNTSDSFLAF